MARRFHKYGKRTPEGFRSIFESEVANCLSADGLCWSYENRKFDITIPRSYTPDFELPNGIILEVKGYFDAEDRRLVKLFKEQHPDVDIRMVFQSARKRITPKSRTTYGMWCDNNNIPWTEGPTLPKDWTLL